MLILAWALQDVHLNVDLVDVELCHGLLSGQLLRLDDDTKGTSRDYLGVTTTIDLVI